MLFTSIVSETRAANTTENVDAIVDEEWIAKRLAVPMQNVSLPQVAKVQQDLAAQIPLADLIKRGGQRG